MGLHRAVPSCPPCTPTVCRGRKHWYVFPQGGRDRLRGIGDVPLELISLPKYTSAPVARAHRVQCNSHRHAQPAASRFLVKDQLSDEAGRGIRFRHDTRFFGTVPPRPHPQGQTCQRGRTRSNTSGEAPGAWGLQRRGVRSSLLPCLPPLGLREEEWPGGGDGWVVPFFPGHHPSGQPLRPRRCPLPRS